MRGCFINLTKLRAELVTKPAYTGNKKLLACEALRHQIGVTLRENMESVESVESVGSAGSAGSDGSVGSHEAFGAFGSFGALGTNGTRSQLFSGKDSSWLRVFSL